LISDGKEYHWNAAEILQNFRPVMYIDNFSEKEGLLYVNSTGIDPAFMNIVNFKMLFGDSFITPIQLFVYLLIAVITFIFLSKTLPIAKTKINGTLSKVFVRLFIIITFTVLFSVIFSPPFLTWDSYHYMVLSFYPEVGTLHPLLFGFILRLISIVAQPLWDNAFTHLFIMFNVFCFFAIIWFVFEGVNKKTLSPAKQFILGIILVIVAVVIVPALFGLINVFWSEMTGFFLVMLTGLFVGREYRKHSYLNLFFIIVSCVLAYHTRYHLLILSIAIICLGIILYIRQKAGLVNHQSPTKWIMLGSFALVAIVLSNRVASYFLPFNTTDPLTARLLMTSVQCTLRCDVSLFAQDCSTAKEIILQPTCPFDALGTPKLNDNSVLSVFKEIGLFNTLRWLVKAPTSTFFQERRVTLEVETFAFDKNIRYLSHHRDVMDYYGRLITVEGNLQNGSAGFHILLRWLGYLYYQLGIYHLLTIIVILASLVIIWVSPSPTAIFLALVCIGNWLLFGYINPIALMRYLMQLLLPGMAALIISITYAMKFRIEDSTAPKRGSDGRGGGSD
jgi:hypothetical protein